VDAANLDYPQPLIEQTGIWKCFFKFVSLPNS